MHHVKELSGDFTNESGANLYGRSGGRETIMSGVLRRQNFK
jgi:hypothetical protein